MAKYTLKLGLSEILRFSQCLNSKFDLPQQRLHKISGISSGVYNTVIINDLSK